MALPTDQQPSQVGTYEKILTIANRIMHGGEITKDVYKRQVFNILTIRTKWTIRAKVSWHQGRFLFLPQLHIVSSSFDFLIDTKELITTQGKLTIVPVSYTHLICNV